MEPGLLGRSRASRWHIPESLLTALALTASLLGCAPGREPPPPAEPATAAEPSATGVEPLPASLAPTEVLPPSPERIALGKRIYGKQCAPCHGADGRGDGEAAYLLYPKPRDLTAGMFAIVSTWDRVPTDEDLFRTISRGMPGSAMPSWSHLTQEERWGLVHFIKGFSRFPFQIPSPSDPKDRGGVGAGIVRVPPEPPYDGAARNRAEELYREACASCHGPTGRGDGVKRQLDDRGFETRPRDLTRGIYKGHPDPGQVYRRIIAGMPGTPMPMSSWAFGEDAWHLVHFVLEMSSEEQRARTEMRRFSIPAIRVPSVPEHPDSGVWRHAPAVNIRLMPLWWRDERPEGLTVRALHDGARIGLWLQWGDETHDHTAIRPQDFRDAAAVEFSLSEDPPFFAMGERARSVNIWMWKSERQADLEPAFQDLDKIYPNIGIDSYPNLLKAPYEQPTRHALTLDSDPAFITAWGAGNIVADPLRQSSGEDLHAQGFGTLRARPGGEQGLEVKGVYGMGSYRVVFRRRLAAGGDGSVRIRPGSRVPVAFAVWDGSAGDRDGKKSVTVWQELKIAP